MRYKFRGKRIDGQGWVYGWSLWPNLILPLDTKYTNTSMGLILHDYYEVLPESVGQFVNRTDKWGKEIYVGDTVEGYYIEQIYGCSVSKVLIKIEQYEDVVKLDELDSFAVLMEVE